MCDCSSSLTRCLLWRSLPNFCPRKYRSHSGRLSSTDSHENCGIIRSLLSDDLIDLLQDTAKAGKTLGTDAASGKLTLPMILERNRRGGDPAGELRRGLKARDVISHDTWSECFRILEAEISAAEQVLQPIHGTASSDFLHRLTAYLRESTRKLSSAS
ncbi:MAG: hypothetical protein EBS00_00185 [Verrucomicrobia bacterium]|nr:hypothetical protein [Verrucomicrobiota bacterium]